MLAWLKKGPTPPLPLPSPACLPACHESHFSSWPTTYTTTKVMAPHAAPMTKRPLFHKRGPLIGDNTGMRNSAVNNTTLIPPPPPIAQFTARDAEWFRFGCPSSFSPCAGRRLTPPTSDRQALRGRSLMTPVLDNVHDRVARAGVARSQSFPLVPGPLPILIRCERAGNAVGSARATPGGRVREVGCSR